MSFTAAVAGNAFRQLLREKWALLSWLLIPLIIGGLFHMLAGGGDGPRPQGVLLLSDEDDSLLSRFVAGGFNQGPMAEMFTVQSVDRVTAQARMDAGEASAWLLLEEGLQARYLDRQPVQIQLLKNPAQSILPNIAEGALQVVVDGGEYIQRLFADEVQQLNRMLSADNPDDAQVAQISLAIRDAIESVSDWAVPPRLSAQKKASESAPSKTLLTFGLLMFPGIVFMSLLFAAQGLAAFFWQEKKLGITARLLSSPSATGHYLLGKLLNTAGVMLLLSLLLVSLALLMHDIAWQRLPLMLLWLMLSGVLLWLLMLLLCLLLPTQKSANIVLMSLAFPLLMLGGSFFPFENMPAWMVAIGSHLPNGFMLHAFKQWLLHGEGWQAALLWPGLIALVLCGLLWWVNQRVFRQFAARSRA